MKSERISPFWVGGYHPFSARAGYGLEQIVMLYSVETIADEEGASYERRKTAGNRT